MAVTLYTFDQSPPGHAARLMLEHKGVEFATRKLLPGLHPALLRLRGFEGGTVPALDWNGEKVQGSRAISRFLDERVPEPPLFPADPERARAVREAEEWGERFQDTPRHLFRWAAARHEHVRRYVGETAGAPLAGLTAKVSAPLARRVARDAGVTEASARAAQERVAGELDHVDALIAEGVIGGAERNAADFQILPIVRALLTIEETRELAEGRPCAQAALALVPEMGRRGSIRLSAP